MRNKALWPWIALAAIVALSVVQLRLQGRIWWCKCETARFWIGEARSEHTSQHLSDPYTFTHVLHGFLFFWLLTWLAPRAPFLWKLVIATALEAAWEVIENTQFVIGRYREETAALGYEGDAILNTLGDIVAAAAGVAIAQWLGWRRTLIVFLVVECVLLLTIRDSLFLSALTLVFPSDTIRAWQVGG